MATDIVIPALGESISEGVVSAWLVEEGEFVERDAPVLELETDKITMEVPAPVAGVVTHGAAEGDTVEVGTVVGSIAEGEGKPAASGKAKGGKKQAESGKESSGGSEAAVAEKKSAKAEFNEAVTDQPASSESHDARTSAGSVSATPLARKLAEDHHIDLSRISGTGPSGRVREQDVLAYIQTTNGKAAAPVKTSAPAQTSGPASRGTRLEKMSPLRQRIASRLVEAQQTAAMLTTFNECDMTKVMALRSRLKDAFQEQHGVKLGFMSFFVKAAVSALHKVPNVNSFIVETNEGPAVERHDYCDIAIAVGTKKGLVVPVLRNCESLSFAGVEQGIMDLANKARDGKLTLEDMQGGTFTISNGGVYGSMMSTPILNPPQSGILGMHNIIRRPIENPDKPGSGEIAVRPMMYLALSYDHRIVDGEGAVTFLKHIKECIEDPDRLLLGV
jgi:2-oxoglutarate dehydrogenase E2 component (dihydrolipoamide succinyltransferase)